MNEQDEHEEVGGLRWAYVLGGEGPARSLDWEAVRSWSPEAGPLWVHLNRSQAEAQAWIREDAGLDPAVGEALLAEETRPRCYAAGEGLLLILRGVNLNPGADPDDMIALRCWADGKRLITLRQRRLKATRDLAEQLEAGTGPRDLPDLLVRLVTRLTERIEPVLENLEERADELEEELGEAEAREVRRDLAELRRQVIAIRRYLSPQRAVLATLAVEPVPWFQPAQRTRLRELSDWSTRHVEDLEALRERAGVIHDELANRVAEQLNARMYILSIVTAIFLPLGLLTGLLGINVAGIPGAEAPHAFLVVCGLLAAVALGLVVVLRRAKWL